MKQTRAEWLEERKTYIGASEIAAICGINSYDTPRHVWMVKKGLATVEDNLPMKIGRLLEDTVAQEFAKEIGVNVRAFKRSGLVRQQTYEYFGCNPDRIWKDSVIQIKTCNQYASGDFGKTGTDEVKDEYLIQVAWEMWICKKPKGYMPVLIGNNDFRWFAFEWNDTIQAIVKRAAEEANTWWHDYYLKDELPPLMGHDKDTQIVTASYREHNDEFRTLTPEMEAIVKDWPSLQAQYDQLDRELKRRKNLLREFIGNTAGALSPIGEPIATWKADKNGKRSLRLKFEEAA